MSKRILIALLALTALVGGCGRDGSGIAGRRGEDGGGRGPPILSDMAERSGTRLAMKAAASAPFAPARQPDGTMAYEHSLTVEIEQDRLQARLDELANACKPDAAAPCTVLDVQSRANDAVPTASLRLRIAPAGVEPLIALAGRDARITNRSTHAEDLAEPLADTDRQLALLTTHRDRLLELQKARNLNVDQLITLSRELSSTQAQLEAMANERANLRRRVDTELLSIELTPPAHEFASGATPIRAALRAFGATLRQAVANVIEFIAVLIPWLVIVVPGLIAVRLLWRAITRWLVRREQRG